MATLGPLSPNADGAIDTASILKVGGDGTTYWSCIEEDPAVGQPDADYVYNSGTSSGTSGFQFTDTPADFGTMDTLSIETFTAIAGRTDDNINFYATVFQNDGTTALTSEARISGAANPSGRVTTTFTLTAAGLAAGKAVWDQARLRVRWEYLQNMSKDNYDLRLHAFELNGTYTAAVVIVALDGSANSGNDAVASINAVVGLAGSAGAAAQASGDLTLSVPLAGTANSASDSSGGLGRAIHLDGVGPNAALSVAGELRAIWKISGSVDAAAQGVAQLDTFVPVIYLDDFNRPDEALEASADWTLVFLGTGTGVAVVNNQADSNSANAHYRFERDLATADHYAQGQGVSNGQFFWPLVRFDPAAFTYYQGRWQNATSTWRIMKRIAGTETMVAESAVDAAPAGTVLMRLEVEGSDLRLYADGVLKLSTTDTSITGFKRTGFASTSGALVFDDFKVGDLAASEVVQLDGVASTASSSSATLSSVVALAGSSSNAASAIGSLGEPGGPPQNLVATAVSPSQIDLTWDVVTGALGYDIERDGSVLLRDHGTNSYSDTGLNEATEHTYRVRAVTA